MSRASPIQTAFNAGEVSPKLEGRVDIGKYGMCLQVCENFIAEVQGGASRRPGTRFVAPVRYPDRTTVLLPYQFSTEQAYALEFGHLYIRFYRNHGPLLETAKTITGATQTNPVVLTSAGHGWANGDDVEIVLTGGMVQLNGRRFRVANVTATTFELTDPVSGANIDGTAYSAFSASGTAARVYTLATTYQEVDLTTLKVAQDKDTLFIVHPEYVSRKLSRLAAAMWSLAQIDFTDGPYLPVNASQATISPSATTGAGITISSAISKAITGAANNGAGLIRITSSNHGWLTGDTVVISLVTGTTEANGTWTVTRISANTYDLQASTFANAYVSGGAAIPRVFLSTDVGRLVRIKHSATWGYARIVAYTSAVSVTADVLSAFGATTASADWRLGLYSTGGGYAGSVTFFENRLFLAGCPLDPARVDGSKTGLYENFAPSDASGSVANDNAVYATLNSGDVNAIRWLKDDEKGLLSGTAGGEWVIRANSAGDILTPSNIKAVRPTNFGSADYQPVRAGTDVVFIQRGQRKIRNLSYVFEDDGFRAGDLTVLSEHITLGGCQQMSYQAEPNNVVWIVRGGGQLLSMTYSRDQDAIGWARHVMGGFADAAETIPAIVGSVCSIPSPDTTRDETWVIVQRRINGQTARYVEWISPEWETGSDQQVAFYVDSGLTYDGAVAGATLAPGVGADVKNTTGVTFTASSAIFVADDVGRQITYRYYDYDAETYRSAKATITGYTNGSVVTATISAAFPDLTLIPASGWRLTTNVITGLWHLEGQIVTVLADGATHPPRPVVNGQITLTLQAGFVSVGLGYSSTLQTMRVDAGARDGTSQGKTKRIIDVVLRFHQTLGGMVGPALDALTRIEFRGASDPTNTPPAIRDGDTTPIKWDKGYETAGRMYVQQNQPLPMTVLAIMPQVVTNDKG